MVFDTCPYTKILDYQLKEIDGLQWYPFIGNEYFSISKKILVIGESHYADVEGSYDSEEYKIKVQEWKNPLISDVLF